MKKLYYLCLFDGKLKTLPADIGQLANLRILNLNLNQLTSLPEEIGQLSTLDQLLLSSNQLTTLPTSICQLKTLKTLAFSENPIKKVPECVASMSAKPSIFETVEALAESDAPDSAYMLLAQKLLTSNYVAAYNSTLLSIEADSTDANLYFNLSFYALFVGDYKKSIEAAQKTLQLNPSAVKVETNLALGYLLDNQYDKAEAIYKKWKGKKFDTSDDHTANTIFLKDIDDLEGIGTQHNDFVERTVRLCCNYPVHRCAVRQFVIQRKLYLPEIHSE